MATRTISLAEHKASLASNRAIQAQKRAKENAKKNASSGTVTRRGKVIYDPKTGAAIGSTYTEVKTGKVTITFTGGKTSGIVTEQGKAIPVSKSQPLSIKQIRTAARTGRIIQTKEQPKTEQKSRYTDLFMSRAQKVSESSLTDKGGRPISTRDTTYFTSIEQFQPKPKEVKQKIQTQDNRPTFQGIKVTGQGENIPKQETIKKQKFFTGGISKQSKIINKQSPKQETINKQTILKTKPLSSFGKPRLTLQKVEVSTLKKLSNKIQGLAQQGKFGEGIQQYTGQTATYTSFFQDKDGTFKPKIGRSSRGAGIKTAENIVKDVLLGAAVGGISSATVAKFPATKKILQLIGTAGLVLYSKGIPYRVKRAGKDSKNLVVEFAGDAAFIGGLSSNVFTNTVKKIKKTQSQVKNKKDADIILKEYFGKGKPSTKQFNKNFKDLSGTEKALVARAYKVKYGKTPTIYNINTLVKSEISNIKKGKFDLSKGYSVKKGELTVIDLKKPPKLGQKTLFGGDVKINREIFTGFKQLLSLYKTKAGITAKTDYIPKKYTLLEKKGNKIELSMTVKGVVPKFKGNKIIGYKNIGDIQIKLKNDKIVATNLKDGSLIEINDPKKLFTFDGKTYVKHKGEWLRIDQLRTIGDRVSRFNKEVKKLNPDQIKKGQELIKKGKKSKTIEKINNAANGLVLSTVKMSDFYKDLGLTSVQYKPEITKTTGDKLQSLLVEYKTPKNDIVSSKTVYDLVSSKRSIEVKSANQKLESKQKQKLLILPLSKQEKVQAQKVLIKIKSKLQDQQKVISKSLEKQLTKSLSNQKLKTLQKQIQKLLQNQKINQKVAQTIIKLKDDFSKKDIFNTIYGKITLPKLNLPKFKLKSKQKEVKENIKKLLKKYYNLFYTPTLAGAGLRAKRTTGRFTGFEVRGNIIKPVKVKKYSRRNLKKKNFVRRHRRSKPKK